jgi:hypothetical protein
MQLRDAVQTLLKQLPVYQERKSLSNRRKHPVHLRFVKRLKVKIDWSSGIAFRRQARHRIAPFPLSLEQEASQLTRSKQRAAIRQDIPEGGTPGIWSPARANPPPDPTFHPD